MLPKSLLEREIYFPYHSILTEYTFQYRQTLGEGTALKLLNYKRVKIIDEIMIGKSF